MTATVPTREPEKLRAGDTVQWRRELPDYPATDWTLRYHLRNAAGSVDITASAYATTAHEVLEAAAITADWTAGTYRWAAVVDDGSGVKHTVATGTLEVLANLQAAGALDDRSTAEKGLAAINAVIEGRASRDQMAYQIAGRRLDRTPIADLLRLKSHLAAEVARERATERQALGLGGRNRILYRG
jgi:hypothetical protein